MRTVLRKLRNHCVEARASLLRAGCAMPFGLVGGTPLQAVADDTLALVNGLFGGTGAAVVLRPGLAATSAHVVAGRRRLFAWSRQGPVEAVVAARSERLDLALLRLPERFGSGAAIARATPGLAVWAMGATTASRLAPVAAGRVACVAATAWLGGTGHRGLRYAAAAGPGYSGGPVVDAEGRLVGLTEGIYTSLDGAVPASPMMFAYHARDIHREASRLLQCEIDGN